MKKILSLLAFLALMVSNAIGGEVFTFDFGTSGGTATPSDFFTHSTDKWSFNTKYKDATYGGKAYTMGLKLESGTWIGFTNAKVAKVTIVQATNTQGDQAIKFDDVEIPIANGVDGTNYREYILENVGVGEHKIARSSKETGLFLVKVEYPSTVTFINDANWAKVNVWAWNQETNENFTGGVWPGQEMTEKDNDENYTWSTFGNPTHIVFNNGTAQTVDLEFKDGGKYNSTGRIIELNDYTVTFKSDGMTEAWAYAWNGDDKPLGEWPGTKMTAEGDGFSITIKAEEAPKYIIFHDNQGNQTQDLAFEDGKAYEFNLSDYTATFTTDAEWTTVYAYAWTTTGEGEAETTKEFVGEWPGTALTGTDGVYNFSLKSFYAPQMIQFNDGKAKTSDLAFTNGKAYKWITATPTYALAEGATFASGTTVDVKDGDDVVATLTYGVDGGSDFLAAIAQPNEDYAGFTAYTPGNGVNGASSAGTVYIIKPKYDGTITVGVRLNGGKSFFIEEDGTPMADYNGITIPDAANTSYSFAVKAGSTYNIYCTGSKLGFFGFDYQYASSVTITSVALMGSSNNWAEPIATFSVENASTGYWTANDVKFAANDEFKIRVLYSNDTKKWLLPQSEGNFLVNQDVLDKNLSLVEGGNNNMYVENAATLSFSLNPGFTTLTITGEITDPSQPATETTSTYVFTSASWTATLDDEPANWISGKNGAGFNNNGVQVTANGTGANATSPESFDNISKIVVTYNTNKSAGAGTLVVKIGDNDAVTKDWAYSGTEDGRTANFTLEYDYATPQSGAVTITANTTTNSIYIVSVAITHVPAPAAVAKPTFTPAGGTYVGVQNVTLACETEGATIYYTTDESDPTPNSEQYTEAIVVNQTTTIKAIAVKGTDESKVAEATYTILPKISNPKEQPYSVAQALDLISLYQADPEVLSNENNKVYVKGTVTNVPTKTNTYTTQDYALTDGTVTLKVFRGKNLDEADLTYDAIKALEGKTVVVYGNLKDYVQGQGDAQTHTSEFDSGNYIVSIETPITSMAIVGDFLGLDATGATNDPNWDPANGWQMTKSTENPAIWTLTVEGFEAEAKTYYYKATVNEKWGDYELPAEGNQNFVFGTDEYPAGKYNLTFTADTEKHTLDIDVEPVVAPTGLIPDGTYYVMSANEGTVINAAGALDAAGAPITFTFNAANNAYTIEGADFFAGKQWTIANAIEGASGFYTISTADGFLAASETNTLEQIADGTADAAVWILLEKAYWEDIVNSTYTVAGTKDLTGTEKDWDIVEANQMTLNDNTGLYEKVFKNIAVNDESQPAFKVVQTNNETGEQTWYPASDNSGDHNWVITPNVVGGEGLFDITITFDPSDFKEINVSAVKIEPELALGDVNGDTEVTTTDAVMAVDFALGKSVPTTAQFNAANVVKAAAGEEEAITVADAIGIVNIAIGKSNDDPAAGARLFDEGNNFLTLNGQTLSLTNSTAFAGFQMDVTLAEGAQFNGAQLTERASNLNLVYNRIGENTWRIIALSLQGNTISGSNGALLTLDIMGNSTVSVSNIEFADAAANAYALGFGGATGINSVYGVSADSDIYNLNGVRTNTMHKGMNIIRNANGEVKKVFVK